MRSFECFRQDLEALSRRIGEVSGRDPVIFEHIRACTPWIRYEENQRAAWTIRETAGKLKEIVFLPSRASDLTKLAAHEVTHGREQTWGLGLPGGYGLDFLWKDWPYTEKALLRETLVDTMSCIIRIPIQVVEQIERRSLSILQASEMLKVLPAQIELRLRIHGAVKKSRRKSVVAALENNHPRTILRRMIESPDELGRHLFDEGTLTAIFTLVTTASRADFRSIVRNDPHYFAKFLVEPLSYSERAVAATIWNKLAAWDEVYEVIPSKLRYTRIHGRSAAERDWACKCSYVGLEAEAKDDRIDPSVVLRNVILRYPSSAEGDFYKDYNEYEEGGLLAGNAFRALNQNRQATKVLLSIPAVMRASNPRYGHHLAKSLAARGAYPNALKTIEDDVWPAQERAFSLIHDEPTSHIQGLNQGFQRVALCYRQHGRFVINHAETILRAHGRSGRDSLREVEELLCAKRRDFGPAAYISAALSIVSLQLGNLETSIKEASALAESHPDDPLGPTILHSLSVTRLSDPCARILFSGLRDLAEAAPNFTELSSGKFLKHFLGPSRH